MPCASSSSSSVKRRFAHVFSTASRWNRSSSTPSVPRFATSASRLTGGPMIGKRPFLSAISQPRNPTRVLQPDTLQWHCNLWQSLKSPDSRSFSALAYRSSASQGEILYSAPTGNGESHQPQEFSNENVSCSEVNRIPVLGDGIFRPASNEKDASAANIGVKDFKVVQESVQALEGLLKEVETSEPDGDLRVGALCLRLAQLCISKDENPDKILLYGQRAMAILGKSEVSLEYATCLEIIGCGHCKKGEFDKAVSHLERAAFILEKLKATVKEEELGSLQYSVQALLGQANMSLGREEEALVNFQDAIAVNERALDTHDPNLAKSYHQIAESFMQVQDLQEARITCLKALPIYINCYGSTSLQVAELRKLLSVIYYGLDNFENVLSEHEIIRPIYEAHGKAEELARLDLAAGEALLCLSKYTKATSKLKAVITQTTTDSHFHGQALVLLAKAYAYSKKEKNAKKHCQLALEVLRNQSCSAEAGASAVELALVYKQVEDTEQALSTFKMSLEIYRNYPAEKVALAFIEGQIGLILLTLGRALEALPYLETCLASDEVGLRDKELLDVYNQLGAAYLQLGKLDEALAKLEAGRKVAEDCGILKDPAVAMLYNNLTTVYTTLGRIEKALLSQQHLVKILNNKDVKTQISLDDAEKRLESLLQEIEKKA